MFTFQSLGAKSVKITAVVIFIWLLVAAYYSYSDVPFYTPKPLQKTYTYTDSSPVSDEDDIQNHPLRLEFFPLSIFFYYSLVNAKN